MTDHDDPRQALLDSLRRERFGDLDALLCERALSPSERLKTAREAGPALQVRRIVQKAAGLALVEYDDEAS